MNFNSARFVLSAPNPGSFPADNGVEVAFAGRSNAGKSSAINTIAGIRGLARTSKTPGRTQAINYFELSHGQRLVDLPGYGFAKVPETMRLRWAKLVEAYLNRRQSLRGVVIIMDVRRPLTELDLRLIDWCGTAGVAMHILLSKADKLGRSRGEAALHDTRRQCKARGDNATVQLFSALSRRGVDDARQHLNGWLNMP